MGCVEFVIPNEMQRHEIYHKVIKKSMERTARFHAFLNNVSLFTNIRMHLIWNDKFHTAHVHWCDIARVCEKIS